MSGVQELAWWLWSLSNPSIDMVPYDRMMDRRHMDSYLVGSAAFQLDLQESAPLCVLQCPEPGAGEPAT